MLERWYGPLERALRSGAFVAAHFAVASVFVATNYLIEKLLRELGDPRLYDLIPWRYVFDTIDIGLVIVFGSLGIGKAVRVFRGPHD